MSEVALDGLLGDKQSLGYVAVSERPGGEFGDPQLAGGQGRAAADCGASGARSGREQLLVRACGQQAGAAADGELMAGLQGCAGGDGLARTAQRAAQVNQRPGVLELAARALQYRDRLPQSCDAVVRADQGAGAQRDPERAGGPARSGQGQLLSDQPPRLRASA